MMIIVECSRYLEPHPPQDSPSLPLKLSSAASTDEGVWTSCYESGSASTPSTEDKLDDNTNSISSCVNVSHYFVETVHILV